MSPLIGHGLQDFVAGVADDDFLRGDGGEGGAEAGDVAGEKERRVLGLAEGVGAGTRGLGVELAGEAREALTFAAVVEAGDEEGELGASFLDRKSVV
jgi:hypothetical protein